MRSVYEFFFGCLRYCKSTIFQANHNSPCCLGLSAPVVCDTAKVRFFKQITTQQDKVNAQQMLFAILQKYDFSSKSQPRHWGMGRGRGCLRYCKSTIFQANHNYVVAVCGVLWLFAILQKYDFSSKSQLVNYESLKKFCCLRYCKSTIFQANHNSKCTPRI